MAVRGGPCQGGLDADGGSSHAGRMSGKDEERARRLAEALRENLRRRKAQARGEEEHSEPAESPLHLPAAGRPPRFGED